MMWQIRYENNQTFIYLFIYAASPINYMYMKTTIQNSHTHTQRKEKKAVWQGHDNSFRQLLWVRVVWQKR